MLFKVRRDFFGIDNTLYRVGQMLELSESKLMYAETGKVKPEIKHLEPRDEPAQAFYSKYAAGIEQKVARIPEKMQARGRGRQVVEPEASTLSPKAKGDDKDPPPLVVGIDLGKVEAGPGVLPKAGDLFNPAG